MSTKHSNDHHSTHELGSVVLRPRSDLEVGVREFGGRPVRVLIDRARSRFFRIGEAEFVFLSLLDGQTTFAAALGKTAAVMRDQALDEHQAATFCGWLVQSGLATTQQTRGTHRLVAETEDAEKRRARAYWGLLYQRIPLFRPGPWLEKWELLTHFFFHPLMAIGWVLLVGTGCLTVFTHWDEFTGGAERIVARDNWLWLAAAWFLLKAWHELGHAFASQRCGSHVRECGLAVILFAPMPYVDVSSSSFLASKWHRILIAASGLLFELPVAAIAALAWNSLEPGLARQNALNLVYAAGFTTLVFNANPLMKFDAYYMLSDFLEIPNLAKRGSAAVQQILGRMLLGAVDSPAAFPEDRPIIVAVYGVAASVWRVIVTCGLILAADAMFYGSGTPLAWLAAIAWIALPLWRTVRSAWSRPKADRPALGRVAASALFVLCTLWIALAHAPWSGRVSVVAVVDHYPRTEVRAAVAGFVDDIAVEAGDWVEAGEPIARLSNDELRNEHLHAALEVRRSEARSDRYLAAKEIAAWQVEQETLLALRKRERELAEQVGALDVISPTAGRVLGDTPRRLIGSYLRAGELLTIVGSSSRKEILAQVGQRDLDAFQRMVGQEVSVHVAGDGLRRFSGRIVEVAPKAQRRLVHPALGAHCGGDLDVREVSHPANEARVASHAESYELASPHFLVRIELPPHEQERHGVGQIAGVSLPSKPQFLGERIWRTLLDWWDRRQMQLDQEWYR
jgi:putative peptide zinc metalloprotease protein